MILALKEANPDQLHSNIKYLQNYTHPTNLFGELGYVLTQFMSAAVFLENADAAALTISPIEFERAIQRCKEISTAQVEKISGRRQNKTSSSTSLDRQHVLNLKGHRDITVDAAILIPRVSVRDVKLNRQRAYNRK